MRALLLCAVLAAAGLGSCSEPHSPAASLQLGAPHGPHVGLWTQRVSDARGASAMQYCLGPREVRALLELDRRLAGRCARLGMSPAAGSGWRFETRCGAGASALSARGEERGDFRSRLLVAATLRTARGAPDQVTAEVRRIGDCPGYMSAGDVILADGRRTTLAALARGA